jgi:hypothetical protein
MSFLKRLTRLSEKAISIKKKYGLRKEYSLIPSAGLKKKVKNGLLQKI